VPDFAALAEGFEMAKLLRMKSRTQSKTANARAGKLRIGNDWNAITIIATSQSSPLKAVAEFVENSIDAHARRIVITRGRDRGEYYLRITDDGEGIRRNSRGEPDFDYVATHICDSFKRRLKAEGAREMQGEFGIGLLSFWTVGERLTITSSDAQGTPWQMHLRKGEPGYTVTRRNVLFGERGTELVVRGLLAGVRQFSGEKIQWFLAAELRDRIKASGVDVRIIDKTTRFEAKVEPREFGGRLLHDLKPPGSDLYLEIYLDQDSPQNAVALSRHGTRVLADIAELEIFRRPPWTSGSLQGIIDAPWINLTPGTRLGVIHDDALDRLATELAPIEAQLSALIAEQQRAEEERASRDVLRSIQKALRDALQQLPPEEYDWFNLHAHPERPRNSPRIADDPARLGKLANGEIPGKSSSEEAGRVETTTVETATDEAPQFFEFAGPLFSVRIQPVACVTSVDGRRTLRAVPRDRAGRQVVDDNVTFQWTIADGAGRLDDADRRTVLFHAPAEPGLIRIEVIARAGDVECHADAMITVTDTLLSGETRAGGDARGIPGYTFERAPGELWRSRFEEARNVIIVNSGHRDFVFAARHKALKLRYLTRLFAKELVLRNFIGLPAEQLLERLLELILYTEQNLK
jgi:hypothetical protein